MKNVHLLLFTAIMPAMSYGLVNTYVGVDNFAAATIRTGEAAYQQRQLFEAELTGVSTEGFEGFADEATGPLAVSFTGSAGTINGTLTTLSGTASVQNVNPSGTWATEGTNHWIASSSSSFEIDFGATELAAFGAYVTDVENTDVTFEFFFSGGGSTVVNSGTAALGGGENANLSFVGYINTTNPFTRIVITGTTETYGFDQFTVGDANQVPEPSSYAMLAGVLVLGMAAVRRRKHR